MAKFFLLLTLCLTCLSLVSSCKSHETINNEYAYCVFPTQFISKTASCEIIIKCWGSGSTVTAAVDNALKNGLETILFKGLTTSGKPIVPLVTSPDTKARSLYFDRFFNNNTYRLYIKEDKSVRRAEAISANLRQVGLIAVVDVKALESLLINDNILTR